MFEIDGVECKFEPGKGPDEWKNARVRMGMQLPSKQRVVIKMICGENAKEAAVRDPQKFAKVKALVDALAGNI